MAVSTLNKIPLTTVNSISCSLGIKLPVDLWTRPHVIDCPFNPSFSLTLYVILFCVSQGSFCCLASSSYFNETSIWLFCDTLASVCVVWSFNYSECDDDKAALYGSDDSTLSSYL